MIFKVYCSIFVLPLFIHDVFSTNGECRDLNGRTINQDMHYVPGPDSCTLCICDNGHPKWCKAVLCSPPQDCKSFRVGKSCCEFICLDDALSKGEGLDLGSDFGLRLVFSAVAAVLSLCLLFFLVHRLRQRKIRGRQNRQLSEDERSLASIGYITGSLGYLPQTYFGGPGGPDRHLELHYEEPPAHLSLWKPSGNYFPRGEAPPPYEEAVSQTRAELTISTSNTLPNISHRTIPLNVTTTGTIRFVNPVHQGQGGLRHEGTPAEQQGCGGAHSRSSGSLLQGLDPSTVCIVENTNTILRHSLVNTNANFIATLGRGDVNANSVVRSTVSLPRNVETRKAATNILKTGLVPRSEVSTLRYEININGNAFTSPEGFYNSLRKPRSSHKEASLNGNVDLDHPSNSDNDVGCLPLQDIPPPLPLTPDSNDDSSVIPSDVLYEEVALLTASPTRFTSEGKESSQEGLDMELGEEELPPPLLDDPPSSCDCSSLQCLTNNDDNDDYRSECENCKSGHGSSYYLDEEPEPPETMTLQRQVTKEADEFEGCRTSLTLPTHCRRPTRGVSGARENWFSSMPESGTSSEED